MVSQTMTEEFHTDEEEVPEVICALCSRPTTTQAYEVVLRRPKLMRKWNFCSLSHLRQWAAPVR